MLYKSLAVCAAVAYAASASAVPTTPSNAKLLPSEAPDPDDAAAEPAWRAKKDLEDAPSQDGNGGKYGSGSSHNGTKAEKKRDGESSESKSGGAGSGNATKAQKNCKEPDPRGYLLWTGYLPEFNNQLITLAETILLNKQLKRKLVLTGFMELKDPGSAVNASDGIDYQLDPWAHVLHPTDFAIDNKKTMENLGYSEDDWTTPERLVDICEMRAEAHAFIHYFEIPPTLPHTRKVYTKSPYHVQEKIWHGDGATPQGHPIPELKDMGLRFSEAKITVHDSTDIQYMSTLPSGTEAPMLIMDYLFYSNNNFHPPYADTAYDFYDTIAKYEWSHEVKGTAQRFRTRHFGEGVKYIALHWRRGFHVASAGDDNRGSVDISYTHEEVASALKERLKHGCVGCPVYIASNNMTQEDVYEIRHIMGDDAPVISSLMLNPPDEDLSTLSRAEMALCTWAHIFIPSADSTWSANVMAMRGDHINGPPAPESLHREDIRAFARAGPSSHLKPHVLSPNTWRVPAAADAAAIAEIVDQRNAEARKAGAEQKAGLEAAAAALARGRSSGEAHGQAAEQQQADRVSGHTGAGPGDKATGHGQKPH